MKTGTKVTVKDGSYMLTESEYGGYSAWGKYKDTKYIGLCRDTFTVINHDKYPTPEENYGHKNDTEIIHDNTGEIWYCNEKICLTKLKQMGNKKEKNRIIKEATERGFVIGAIHSGIDGKESDRFEITEPLHFAGWHLYGGESGCIYNGGRWAKIIMPARKPLFVTEDGVNIYDGTPHYSVYVKSLMLADNGCAQRNRSASSASWKTFSTRKAAEDWIALQKQKQKEADLIREAEKRGLIDGAKYKWDNNRWIHLPERIIKYPLYVNGKGDLCDFMSNIISKDGEWPTVITEPKSLKPEELVEGEIYFADAKDGSCSSIFRHKYNNLNDGGYMKTDTSHVYKFQPIRPATLEEKQKLVKAEVNNGFFYKL